MQYCMCVLVSCFKHIILWYGTIVYDMVPIRYGIVPISSSHTRETKRDHATSDHDHYFCAEKDAACNTIIRDYGRIMGHPIYSTVLRRQSTSTYHTPPINRRLYCYVSISQYQVGKQELLHKQTHISSCADMLFSWYGNRVCVWGIF